METDPGGEAAARPAKPGRHRAAGATSSWASRNWTVAALTLYTFPTVLTGTTARAEPPPLMDSVVTSRTDFGLLEPTATAASDAVVPEAAPAVGKRSDREEVAWVKDNSGLTWDQLGKVFGVSRRAVHMWANGGRLNESNAQRLREFSAIVQSLVAAAPGDGTEATPESVRARLLEIGPLGRSIVGEFRYRRTKGPSWGAPFEPEYFIDAVREG